MVGLLILLFACLLTSYILDRDPEEILPPFLMTLMLGVYSLGILKKSHHAYSFSLCAFAVIGALFVIVLIRRMRSDATTYKKSLLISAKEWPKKHIGFIIFLITCVLAIYAYSTHFVYVWDDFHYNATFPKDCWFYGTMPTGTHLATYYKSYFPLQQLFLYWGFQSSGFSEPMMFGYKMVLIYSLLMPLFQRINVHKGITLILAVIFPVVLPFLFMYEVQESLSMDTVIACFFIYAMIRILYEKKRDWLCYYSILTALMCLTLMKTISILFTIVCLGAWMTDHLFRSRLDHEKFFNREYWLIISGGVISFASYISWNVFCKINGNTTYLSQNLASNIEGGITFPEYGSTTIHKLHQSLLTMHLDLAPRGLTLFSAFLLCVLIMVILAFHKHVTVEDQVASVMLFVGFLGYFAVLCYTFLFVFEPWEAEELSSLDRYLGTYATVLTGVFMYRLLISDKPTSSRTGRIVIPAIIVILLFSLPFEQLRDVLIPSRYIESRSDIYAERQEAAKEASAIMDQNLAPGLILIVDDHGNSVYSRSLDYEVIPFVAMEFVASEIEKEDRTQRLYDTIDDERPDYVYFSAHEREFEDTDMYRLPEDYENVNGATGLYKRKGI